MMQTTEVPKEYEMSVVRSLQMWKGNIKAIEGITQQAPFDSRKAQFKSRIWMKPFKMNVVSVDKEGRRKRRYTYQQPSRSILSTMQPQDIANALDCI